MLEESITAYQLSFQHQQTQPSQKPPHLTFYTVHITQVMWQAEFTFIQKPLNSNG